MKTWLLILFLTGNNNHQQYVVSLEFDTQLDCRTNGVSLSRSIAEENIKSYRSVRSFSCSPIHRGIKK